MKTLNTNLATKNGKQQGYRIQWPLDSGTTGFAMRAWIAVAVTGLFGFALGTQLDARYFGAELGAIMAIMAIIICGAGWLLEIIFASYSKRPQQLPYILGLGKIMFQGVLFLLPVTLNVMAGNETELLCFGLSIAASFTWMLFAHLRHVTKLGLPKAMTLTWALTLWVGAGTAVGILALMLIL